MMRKLSFLAMMVLLGTGVAVASSLSVPWFVDGGPLANGVPGKASGVTGLVSLVSTVDTTVVCTIKYYQGDGTFIGPDENNTFSIAPHSALAFRPFRRDPGPAAGGVGGGQEGVQGVAVPDRPAGTDSKDNGSLTIFWEGGATDVQGQYAQYNTNHYKNGAAYNNNDTALFDSTVKTITMSFGHLLPAGVEGGGS